MRERGHEVLPAKFRRIVSGLASGYLHDTLHQESGLRAAGAANGVDRHGIRIDRVDLHVDCGNVVLARQQRGIKPSRDHRPEGRGIGAEVRRRVHAQAQHLAVSIESQFGVRHMITAVRVGEERLRPLRRPFDRPLDLLGRPSAHSLFVVNENLGAESAADVGCDDPELVLRSDALERGQDDPRQMRVLAGRVKGYDIRSLVVVAQRSARLHGVGDRSIVDEVDLSHMLRRRKRRVGRGLVAEMPVEHCVIRREVVHLWSPRRGGACCIDNGGQHAVVDDQFLGAVFGLRETVGDDDGDWIADIERLAVRQRRKGSYLHWRAVFEVKRHAWHMRPDLVGDRIGAGEHRDDARRLQRR